MKKRSKKEIESFSKFFNKLKEKVSNKRDINYEDNLEVSIHTLNYLKESKRNFNDIILIGHLLINLSLDKAISVLNSKDKNTQILKNCLLSKRNENKTNSFVNRDLMLLTCAYNGKILSRMNIDIFNSNFISKNLRERFDVLQKHKFKCFYCGRSPPEVKLELEHFKPKSKGGRDNFDNLVPSCFECNSGKRARIIKKVAK